MRSHYKQFGEKGLNNNSKILILASAIPVSESKTWGQGAQRKKHIKAFSQRGLAVQSTHVLTFFSASYEPVTLRKSLNVFEPLPHLKWGDTTFAATTKVLCGLQILTPSATLHLLC